MTPRIFTLFVYGMGVLYNVTGVLSVRLCSFKSSVINVAVDFSGATLSRFLVSQFCSVSRYGCRFVAAVLCLAWVEVMVMSSA